MKNTFLKKAELLKAKLLGGRSFEQLEAEISPAICGENKVYAAFISVCDKQSRTKVFRCSAPTLEEAWNGACSAVERHISSKGLQPLWIKADIMFRSEPAQLSDVIAEISKGFNEFYRRGISFDTELKTALIEAEINGNRIISYKKKTVELAVVNKYLAKNCELTLSELPQKVILFDCLSAFCDENDCVYPLYSEGLAVGRRNLGEITKDAVLNVIMTSSEYLSMMVHEDGKFDYGFFPIYHSEIAGYNIVRHASSIWSLLCAYRLTKDKFTLMQAKKAISYMISNTYNKYNYPADIENTVYLAEVSANEIKLGANGVAVVMLSEYMDITGDNSLLKICKELGNGILEKLSDNGELFHVMNFPTLTPKEKFRTVYYDGECLFALCRLYGLTKENRWLDAAEKVAGRFIRENYVQYKDHWAAYGFNELTKYRPQPEYFEFGLRNIQENLSKIKRRETTYHTYLELLTAGFELYDRIVTEKIDVPYLAKLDVSEFIDTVFVRAERMLDGYGYPEYVMYFKYPEQALGAFFVRHDGYRIRIDDIQHFCGAYYAFYRNYDKISKLRKD